MSVLDASTDDMSREALGLFRAFDHPRTWCSGICFCFFLISVLSHCLTAIAQPVDRVGDLYAIEIRYFQESTIDGSTGKSSSQFALLERLKAISEQGVELEFDLAENASVAQKEQTWQLPIRVVLTNDGELVLANRAEIEDRLERWMNARSIEPTSCGDWSVTWDATKIQCDPASALELISEAVLSTADFVEGREVYHVAGVGSSRAIKVDSDFYYAEFPINVNYISGRLLEEQLAVRQMLQEGQVEEIGFDPDSIKGDLRIEFRKSNDGAVMDKKVRLSYEVQLNSGKIRRDILETKLKKTRR